jgi:hypothetical protein
MAQEHKGIDCLVGDSLRQVPWFGNKVLQTHINFPRFLPIFPDLLERLSHLAPIY